MGIFDFFGRKKKKEKEAFRDIEADLKGTEKPDSHKIGHYAIEQCEHILEMAKEMEDTRGEYRVVTSYLNDIELLAGLDEEPLKAIKDAAFQVVKLNEAREEYLHTTKKLTDAQFMQLEQEENEIPDAINRLSANETYLDTLTRDMRYLDGEKLQWEYNSQELREENQKLSGFVKFLFGFAIMAAAVMIVLQFALEIDTVFLWIGLIAVMAAAGFFSFVKMQGNSRELVQSNTNYNYAISLLNKVKVKYVNVKNAVDYACEKYHVRTSSELNYLWEQYMDAVREREKYIQTNEDLEYFNAKLIRALRQYALYDPKVWIIQAKALVDNREMVEIKHNLIERRQKLRSRLEYNMNEIRSARAELDDLLEKNPEGREEIQSIMDSIDRMCKV